MILFWSIIILVLLLSFRAKGVNERICHDLIGQLAQEYEIRVEALRYCTFLERLKAGASSVQVAMHATVRGKDDVRSTCIFLMGNAWWGLRSREVTVLWPDGPDPKGVGREGEGLPPG